MKWNEHTENCEQCRRHASKLSVSPTSANITRYIVHPERHLVYKTTDNAQYSTPAYFWELSHARTESDSPENFIKNFKLLFLKNEHTEQCRNIDNAQYARFLLV